MVLNKGPVRKTADARPSATDGMPKQWLPPCRVPVPGLGTDWPCELLHGAVAFPGVTVGQNI